MKKDNIDKQKIFKIIVRVYFIISPIFEVLYLYNHLTTLIRVFCLLLFVLGVLILYKDSRKKFLWLLAYYLSMIGYFIISYVHSKGFVSLAPNVDYNLVSEATTLLKLCMPFTILFILKYVKFSKKDFFKVINSWIIIVAGSIVVLNLCGISLSSYTNEITKYSIFSWGQGLSVNETATKGWFVYSNQETLLLLMMLVLAIYQVLFVNKRSILYVSLVAVAMMMVGTRIGTYGGLLTMAAVIICYVVHSLIFKRKINLWVVPMLGLCLVWYLVLPITPCNQRVEEIKSAHENIVKETSQKKKDRNEQNDEKEEVVVKESDFLNFTQNINRSLVGEQFYTKFYPYEYDKEFWNGILESQKSEDFDYRVLELMIVNRIVEIDDRWTDVLYGISNSRIQNVTNIEEDFVLHYYAYGIIGMAIALMFYWFSSVRLVIGVLKNKNFIDFSILCCFSLFVLGALISGNNVNFLAAMVPMSFVVSFCNEVKE